MASIYVFFNTESLNERAPHFKCQYVEMYIYIYIYIYTDEGRMAETS